MRTLNLNLIVFRLTRYVASGVIIAFNDEIVLPAIEPQDLLGYLDYDDQVVEPGHVFAGVAGATRIYAS